MASITTGVLYFGDKKKLRVLFLFLYRERYYSFTRGLGIVFQ